MSVQEKNEEHIKELEAEIEKLHKEKAHVETKFDYLKKKYKKLMAAHEEKHGLDAVPDNDELMGNTPRPPSSLPPFQSPGAPHDTGAISSRLGNKKIRINTSGINADSDDEEDYEDEDENKEGHGSRVITINDAEGDGDEQRRPLVRGGVSPAAGSEYNTFKNRHR